MGLDADELRSRLLPPRGTFAAVDVVEVTGSTNADLVAAARDGAAEKTALIAGEQTAGRGRRARQWASPGDSGLYTSVLLRPSGVPQDRVGWLTLLGGMAVADLVSDVAGIRRAIMKWPNDVLIEGAKVAGILAEAVPDAGGLAVVLGVGLNVRSLPPGVSPGPGGLPATSLVDEDADVTDLTTLAAGLYERFDALYQRWQRAGADVLGAGLHAEYSRRCGTIGARVRVDLPEQSVTGTARDVDAAGRLLVELPGGETRLISAGDVAHLRTEQARYRDDESTDL